MVPGGQLQEYQPLGEATDRHLYSLQGFFFFLLTLQKAPNLLQKILQ